MNARKRSSQSRSAPATRNEALLARNLDKVIHEKTRLGILTTLAANRSGIPFTDLKELNDLTDGNLNRHLKVLADAGLIESTKADRGRNARTTYRISKDGLKAFVTYLDQMEAVLRRANAATTVANRGTSGSAATRLARE